MSLAGGKIAGGNPKNGRVENDFYATDPNSLRTESASNVLVCSLISCF